MELIRLDLQDCILSYLQMLGKANMIQGYQHGSWLSQHRRWCIFFKLVYFIALRTQILAYLSSFGLFCPEFTHFFSVLSQAAVVHQN